MYEDLIKRLREEADCPDNYPEDSCLMREAADAIEELQKQRDEWESHAALAESFARGWIPVTEMLPEPNAVDEYGFAKGYLVKTDRHAMMHTARYTGEWWILWGYHKVIPDNVTHWMPLPEPPKYELHRL